ncbi:MAG TPA: trypsin-like peptidase domain-containing protein [Gemmatimonadaceae bacterium]|nr:trypsin-like peptidase domain-containing protein [Gemmatimonadaceae bacterium]
MIRRFALALLAWLSFTGVAAAQQSRGELLRAATSAYDDFAPERAVDLLKVAVNPALGPTDTAWVRGVHLLTQILVESNNQDLARTWARWAARIAPEMAIDSVNFVAGAVAVLREARAFTGARTPGDVVTRTTWRWVGRGSTETRGRILVDAAGMPVPVSVRVVGGALVPAGLGLSLPPGSYEIEAGAPGYLPARMTREVLPGVTTVLAFSLTSAALASDVIAENIRQHTFANIVPLSVRRFGTSPACAVGAAMSRDGLVLTSYQAIRGADAITLTTTTPNAPAVRIAAYDVPADLAILQVPTSSLARPDSIAAAATIADGQSVWGMRFDDCRTPADVRVRVSQWTGRPAGTLQLSDVPVGATVGSPMLDVNGRLSGVWSGGTNAIPAPRASGLLETARRSVQQQQLLAINDVSRKENHAYGTLIVASDVVGATARVIPLEAWQWSQVQASGSVPFAFAGPMGRYRVEVTAAGDLRGSQEILVRPGAESRVTVQLRSTTVAGGPAPRATTAQPKKRSKLPWILAAIGGGGAAAALALGGGGGSSPGPGPGPGPGGTGSITFHIPVTPP